MAHNLSTWTDEQGVKRDSCYSLKASPWHKLGRIVDKPLCDPELLKHAGLAWDVQSIGLYRSDMSPVTTHKAIVRSDTLQQLGIVGEGYTPLQHTSLINFFRDVAGIKELTVETAGALGDGETVWMLAKLPGLTLEKGDDISQGYLLIRDSHDGSSTLRICPTMIRVVCANTIAMAQGEERKRKATYGRNTLSGGFCIRHTRGIQTALADVADAYARTMLDYEATRAAFSALTSKPLSKVAFDAMMKAAFEKSDAIAVARSEKSNAETIRQNRENKIASILHSATCNVSGTAGTLWAGLNAITEYVDHDAPTRNANGTDGSAQRFASSCFDGAGSKAKAAAFSAAMSLV